MSENINPKGRKFWAMVIGVTFGIMFIVGCLVKKDLMDLEQFAMSVEGLIACYMGANAWKAREDKKK